VQVRGHGDIALYRHGRWTELGGSRFEIGGLAAGDEDRCALVDEAARGGQAYPAAATGDDCGLTCQESHGFSLTRTGRDDHRATLCVRR